MSPASRLLSLSNPGAAEEGKIPVVPIAEFRDTLLRAVKSGHRLCAFFARRESEPRGLLAVLADDAGGRLLAVASEEVKAYPALTPDLPQAHLFEREIHEQAGILPEGHPWLKAVRAKPDQAAFFAEEGAEVHEVAVGPVHAGIIEPGHFRFQCHGETVHHLEIQLGYQHRGVEALLRGGPDRRSAVLAESISGDTSVGHAMAYSMVLEALAGEAASLRGEALRAAGLELERLANHVGDLGALANDIGFLPATAYFGRLRGEFLNLLMELSGNRYGRGLARPGGAAFDLDSEMAAAFAARLKRAGEDLARIADLFFGEPSVIARLEDTGLVGLQAALDLGLVGPVARACGVEVDVRQDHPGGIYRFRHIPLTRVDSGDVYARAMVRWLEAQRSLEFLLDLIQHLPSGEPRAALGPPRPACLALALVEGWRGEIVHAALTDSRGRFAQYKVVDPSFHNWTGLAMALRGEQISDFPLCNKSFNLSYAGHDL